MTPVLGSCFLLVFLFPNLSGCCNADSRVVSPACLPDAMTLAPGCVSRDCLPVSRSLCDAVTLASGSCLLLVSLSFWLDAVTTAPGSSFVCLPVSCSLCGPMLDAVTPARPTCPPVSPNLVSLCLL